MSFFYTRVIGIPAPQGSKSPMGTYRCTRTGRTMTRMVESSKKVAPWREAVANQVASVLAERPVYFDGAVRLTLQFVMVRTGAEPKGWTRYHTKTPDLSKLVRSTEDALTTSGVWRDDCIVVELTAIKVTAEPGEPTGCCITIEALPEKEKPVVEKKTAPGRGPSDSRGRARRKPAGNQPALAI